MRVKIGHKGDMWFVMQLDLIVKIFYSPKKADAYIDMVEAAKSVKVYK